jgi:hypothetical protein
VIEFILVHVAVHDVCALDCGRRADGGADLRRHGQLLGTEIPHALSLALTVGTLVITMIGSTFFA